MIKRIIVCGLLMLLSNTGTNAQPNPRLFSSDSLLIFAPFTDNSGFTGKWNPQIDIPRFFTVYMRERFGVGIISPAAVNEFAERNAFDTTRLSDPFYVSHYAEYFRVRYVVTATIDEFSIGRFTVSEVQLAGYEAFSATVKISFTLFDAARIGKTGSKAVMYEGEAEGTVKDRGLGITLFGKRTDRTTEYFSLDELGFGSEQFNKTILGEALFQCADELGTKLERAIPGLVSKTVVLSTDVVIDSTNADAGMKVKRQLINGEIVLVDEGEVFINLGTLDKVTVGDILPVFVEGKEVRDPKTGDLLGVQDEKIGEVQIIEIRAEHLSLATILSGKEAIQPKQRVRKVIVR